MTIKTIRNNKKILLVTVISFVVVLTLILSTSLAKYQTTQSIKIAEGTINYSLSDFSLMGIYIESDGEYVSTDTVPDEGYVLNETESYCKIGEAIEDVIISYEASNKSLSISPMTTKGMKCYLYFDEYKLAASEQIIALAGNGQVFNEGAAGYRYEGKDVNNYVEFNNETWRILAVEEGSKIGLVSGEYYIKIIRNESLGDLSWSKNYSNNSNVWSTSNLYSTLNNAYLNSTGEYASGGLNSDARNQIVAANWYTNGADSANYTTSQFYNYERSDLNNYVNNYVGLMYVSDYGYASPTSSCGSTKLQVYNEGCYQKNWVFKNDSKDYYTITPYSPYSGWLFFVYNVNGLIGFNISLVDKHSTLPSVYLKSDISFIEGTTGASDNMFKIIE